MEHLDWALLYQKRGLSVVPVMPGEKFPIIKNWEDREVSEQEVRSWWKAWPTADIGIVTGPATGLLVLDIDEGGSTALTNKPIPPTWTVKTRRGRHYYFKFPKELADVATTKRGIYPGIDTRGRGGQVLAPPSKLGASAPSYAWISDINSVPLADAPSWLVKHLLADTYDTSKLGDMNAGATKGNRHGTLVKLVSGWFNQGMTEPEIIPLADDWNAKNNPPMTAERLKNDLDGILHYFRTGRYLSKRQREYAHVAATAENMTDIESTATSVDDYFNKLETLGERKEPEMKFGWSKLDEVTWGIERKELTVLGAGPGVGKTNLLMNISVNLGVQGKNVLYFSTEMDRDKIYHRYFALVTGVSHRNIKTGQLTKEQKDILYAHKDVVKNRGFHMSTAHRPDLTMVRTRAEKMMPDVLIFDYIQHIKNSSDNRRLEIAEFTMGLKELAKDLNMALICASQFNRPMRDLKSGSVRPFTIYDFAESSNIEKEASIALILQKPEETLDTVIPVKLDIVKNRDDSTPTLTLMFDKRTAKFTEQLDEF